MIARSGKGSILPHIFAVLGVVRGVHRNSQDMRNEDSAKPGMSQDVTP